MNKIYFLLALFLLVSPGSAQRQTEAETGSNIPIPRRARIPDTNGLSDTERARLAMSEFARCTVDRKASQVAELLLLSADQIDGHNMSILADDECLDSGQMRFKAVLLRGALFSELFRRRSVALAKDMTWRLPAIPYDPATPVGVATDEVTRGQLGLLAFADCVVKRDPTTAKRTILALPTSLQENTQFTALLPSLGPCLYKGQKITFSKSILTGALGEVLYRNSEIPDVRAAAGAR